MTIKDFFFKGKKGTGSKKQKKSIKPTVEEFEALGPDPSPKVVMKLFSRSYRILNDVELQNADYPPMMFAEFDDGAQTPDELPGAVGEFGRCADNPIPTSRVLDAMVDIFELVSVDGTRYDRLYLDMYHLGQSQKAPEGYRLIGELTGITGTSIGSSRDFPLHIGQDAFEYACSIFGAPVVSSTLKDMDLEKARGLVKAMEKR